MSTLKDAYIKTSKPTTKPHSSKSKTLKRKKSFTEKSLAESLTASLNNHLASYNSPTLIPSPVKQGTRVYVANHIGEDSQPMTHNNPLTHNNQPTQRSINKPPTGTFKSSTINPSHHTLKLPYSTIGSLSDSLNNTNKYKSYKENVKSKRPSLNDVFGSDRGGNDGVLLFFARIDALCFYLVNVSWLYLDAAIF